MSFNEITNNLILVISKIFDFLKNLFNVLINNYVFRVLLIFAIISFLINLFFKIKYKINNEEEMDEETDEEIDDEFWEDEEW